MWGQEDIPQHILGRMEVYSGIASCLVQWATTCVCFFCPQVRVPKNPKQARKDDGQWSTGSGSTGLRPCQAHMKRR